MPHGSAKSISPVFARRILRTLVFGAVLAVTTYGVITDRLLSDLEDLLGTGDVRVKRNGAID